MSSPITFYLAPKCELELSVGDEDGGYEFSDKPTVFRIIKPDNFLHFDESRTNANYIKTTQFGGLLSPSSLITLPKKIRERAGIPREAKYFAYMHAPRELSYLVDWGKMPRAVDFDGDPQEFVDLPIYKEMGKWFAMLLGAFVYFDKKMVICSVNALSLTRTPYELKMSGPWSVSPKVVSILDKSGRIESLIPDVFHEAGFSSSAWTHPSEMFSSHAICEDANVSAINGAVVFVRDDGSAITYLVNGNVEYNPSGDCEIVGDCLASIKATLVNQKSPVNISTLIGHIGFSAIDSWKRKVEDIWNTDSYTVESFKDTVQRSETLLHNSCRAGLYDLTKYLLENGYRRYITLKDNYTWIPLHHACRFHSGNVKLIKMLLNTNKNSALIPDRYNRYPLHLALDGKAPDEVVSLLLDLYPEAVHQKTSSMKMIPLHIACNRRASLMTIRRLLDSDTHGETINAPSFTKDLPLHMSISNKMPPEVVDLFLKREMDTTNHIFTRNDMGLSPFHIALWNDSSPVVVSLILGKDRENKLITYLSRETSQDISMRRKNSMSMSDGLSVSAINGMLPLHMALQNGNSDVIRILLEREKKKDKHHLLNTVYERDKYDRCALHLACKNSKVNPEIVSLLLDLDPEKKTLHFVDHRGKKPIHYAIENSSANREKEIGISTKQNLNFSVTVEKLNILLTQEKMYNKIRGNQNKRMATRTFDDIKSLCSSIDHRRQCPLLIAVRIGAEKDVIEVLSRLENLYLKYFDENAVEILAKYVQDDSRMRSHIIEKLSERAHFTILFLEVYANVGAIYAFLNGTERLIDGSLTYLEPTILCICISVFFLREFAQIKSEGVQYINDVWSWVEVASAIFLIFSVRHMIQFIEREPGSAFDIQRNLLICSGMILILQGVFFLRSTFLSFARFVGGLLMITAKLVPFFIVSSLLLLAFTYSYRMRGTEACDTLGTCFQFTLQGFFSGSDETSNLLDMTFGIVVSIVLLNVVIAVVGDAWDSATERASELYWSYRVSYLIESRIFAVLQRKITNIWGLTNFSDWIDGIPMIRLTDSIAWTKAPFDVVDTWEKYHFPERYFPGDFANKVKEVHSLEAGLYFAKVRAVQESKKREFRRNKILKNSIWAENEFDIVDSWEKYHEPERYFPDYFALRVKSAHMPRADHYFAYIQKISSQSGDDSMSWILYYWYQVQTMLLFSYHLLIYIVLLALGFPLGGWFWPKSFRVSVLSLGIDDRSDEI